MSLIKFELKKEHVLLLKNLQWSRDKNNVIVGLGNDGEEIAPPFGFDTIYEAIDLILNGKPADFNPFETQEKTVYSEDQIKEWDKLYDELPRALEVILFNGNFDLGSYKTRNHIKDWKK